jgi:hypothetical protein
MFSRMFLLKSSLARWSASSAEAVPEKAHFFDVSTFLKTHPEGPSKWTASRISD